MTQTAHKLQKDMTEDKRVTLNQICGSIFCGMGILLQPSGHPYITEPSLSKHIYM